MAELDSLSVPPLCSRTVHYSLICAVLLWMTYAMAQVLALQPPFGTATDPDTQQTTGLMDFASHLNFARQVWTGRWRDASAGATGYSPAGHIEVLDAWIAKKVNALPFGYSPTMIWILGPITWLDDRTAYILWSVAGMLAVAWMIAPKRDPLLVGILCFLSPLVANCIILGQTGILSTFALVVLAQLLVRNDWSSFLLSTFSLWALTAKPPLALLAGGLLLMAGRLQVVLGGICLSLLSTALIHPFLGPGWIKDYMTLIGSYNSVEADPLFVGSLAPTYMVNLRAVLFARGVSDVVASQICWVLWVGGMIVLVLSRWARRLTLEVSWILAILVTVTFAPHVNQTEDLHLYLAALLSWRLVCDSKSLLVRSTPYAIAGLVFLVGYRMQMPLLLLPLVGIKFALIIEILILNRSTIPAK